MFVEALTGSLISGIAAIAALFVIRLFKSKRKMLIINATFAIMALLSICALTLYSDLSIFVLFLALSSDFLCLNMIYAVVSRSVSFDFLEIVAEHPEKGVEYKRLIEGDPLNVSGRLMGLQRAGLIISENSVTKTSEFGTFVCKCLIEPLYLLRKDEH